MLNNHSHHSSIERLGRFIATVSGVKEDCLNSNGVYASAERRIEEDFSNISDFRENSVSNTNGLKKFRIKFNENFKIKFQGKIHYMLRAVSINSTLKRHTLLKPALRFARQSYVK